MLLSCYVRHLVMVTDLYHISRLSVVTQIGGGGGVGGGGWVVGMGGGKAGKF